VSDFERELADRFAELRARDAVKAPSFSATAQRARRTVRVRPMRAVFAAAAVGVAAFALCFARPAKTLMSTDAIVAWRPASDALLPATLPSAFGTPEPLNASVLDALIYPAQSGELPR
jgi:hypothetical protein